MNKEKVYIAGKFELKDEVVRCFRNLEEGNYEVAYDWTKHKNIKPYPENQATANEYSENEIQGIINSDIFIYLSAETGHTLHMEFGAALVLCAKSNKPHTVYAVGNFKDNSPWLFNKRVKRRSNLEEVESELLQKSKL